MVDTWAALRVAYTDLSTLGLGLDEASSWVSTGCAGWAVRDLLFHLLGDAQRGLVALATTADAPADRDAVTYWGEFAAGGDPDSRGLRAVRTMASAWRLDNLTMAYAETSTAVLTLADRTPAADLIATQGHVLTVADLLSTLVVEATVHHLDLVRHLDRPGPQPLPLALTRATLDDLLGETSPVSWDDASWLQLATGRRSLTEEDRQVLGPVADRLPLLG